MGTPAFPNLGKHCSGDDCKQIDFLPFTFDGCNLITSDGVEIKCNQIRKLWLLFIINWKVQKKNSSNFEFGLMHLLKGY